MLGYWNHEQQLTRRTYCFFFCNLFIFIFILLQKVTILKILDLQCLNHLTERK